MFSIVRRCGSDHQAAGTGPGGLERITVVPPGLIVAGAVPWLVRALIMSPCLVVCQLCQRALLGGSYYYRAPPALLVQYQWRESAMTPGGLEEGGEGEKGL